MIFLEGKSDVNTNQENPERSNSSGKDEGRRELY